MGNRLSSLAGVSCSFLLFEFLARDTGDLSAIGLGLEETSLPSSQTSTGSGNVSVHTSESRREIKTADSGVSPGKEDNFGKTVSILPTELLTDSSYIEKAERNQVKSTLSFETVSRSENDENKEERIGSRRPSVAEVESNYYDAIKPTKAEPQIAQTVIKTSSGEGEGVSMIKSGPQKTVWATSYSRVKRGYGNSQQEPVENYKEGRSEKFTSTQREKSGMGKSYNQIAQNLEKLAKVTVSNDLQQPNKTVVVPMRFRESRDEENRKASPDIQDIITGIVNILNGKGNKQNEPHSGRPARPTNKRINNRGPPKISDVPPIDFDAPPGLFRPMPPKRVPPPYPFDVPPSMPNIPLPPQPHKPGLPKLPTHPFLDGVPLPELVVPDELMTNPTLNHPPELVQPEYDTISASEHLSSQGIPILEMDITPKPQPAQTTIIMKNETQVTTGSIQHNGTNPLNASNQSNTSPNTKVDYSKPKPGGQKQPPSSPSPNKNTNKRVRPTPGPRPVEKAPQNKTTSSPVVKDEKNKTSESLESSNQKENASALGSNKQQGISSNNKPIEKPIKADNKTTVDQESTVLKSSHSTTGIKPTVPQKTETTAAVPPPVATSSTTRTHPDRTTHVVSQNETNYEFDFELPVLLEPSLGIGEATPVLESSIPELSGHHTVASSTPTQALSTQRPSQSATTESSHHFKVRPGIVLDDPEYKPGVHKRPAISARPIVTAPPPNSYYGEIFDVTVHAVQGPGDKSSLPGKPYIVPVDVDGVQVQKQQVIKGDISVITKPEEGQKFVSIDGKRTYINLFGEASSTKITPSTTQPTIIGTGYAVPHKDSPVHQPTATRPVISTAPPRRPFKRPSHPPVRIDTCIVGDDSTCDSAQNEMCKTEDGVSSCHCRPGYNRKKHRDTCRRVVSMLTSLRVDRLYDKKLKWLDNFRDPDSDDYQQLSYEASQAMESAMSMTPFSDDFINSRINSIYVAKNLENNEPAVYVNMTIQLEENFDTVKPAVKQDIQRHLLRVIQRRNNNVGNSAVWVDAPPGSVLALQDVDECSSPELHDCHERATCLNTFGSFKCQCPHGLRDPWVGNVHREGRFCEMCPSDYCNGRGECRFEHGQQVCHCSGSFYGTQCEIDGEVLGVAIGASVAAAIIIILTLVCLCMWSRRWSREQKSAVGAGMGSPVFGYMATGPTVKTPSVGAPPYQVSIEDRIRWAQIADVMAKSNHYAQPEPANKPTRPSFGGYPTLPSHTMSMTGTLPLPAVAPPVPLPRLTLTNKSVMGTYGAHSQLGSIHQSNHGIRSSLETTSSSEEEDRADLLGRNFNAPRPKSRTSIANQSGIYYDVEYDRSDIYSKQNTIPMNTYTLNPQHQVRPYFR
ncbi:hypothetical protein RUM44_006620 [Polyplax serrata]|uniref:EGF-like domain-containing protein n=1 Tax=Polyplax serrata TaxID=468196 RepID=A0ABR1AIJ8_POLSC